MLNFNDSAVNTYQQLQACANSCSNCVEREIRPLTYNLLLEGSDKF